MYEYDVFYSYKRADEENDGVNRWHRRVATQLEHWLGDELPHNARVFFDSKTIDAGDYWEKRIRVALKKSRTLVAMFSPSYFRSRWCVSELRTFMQREAHGASSLIVPGVYADGQHFPEVARKLQSIPLHNYTSTLESFWNTTTAVDFEGVLKNFAQSVAAKIAVAPPYNDDFPIVLVEERELLAIPKIPRPSDVIE